MQCYAAISWKKVDVIIVSRITLDNHKMECEFTMEELQRIEKALNYSLVGIDELKLTRVYARKEVNKTVNLIDSIKNILDEKSLA